MPQILIAEDDQEFAKLLKLGLEKSNFSVTLCVDGADALNKIELARPQSFDLVVSDIAMPLMDGIALSLNMARDYPTIPIILMTGYLEQGKRAIGIENLVEATLQKPFKIDELVSLISSILNK